jgi:hypothetical protein
MQTPPWHKAVVQQPSLACHVYKHNEEVCLLECAVLIQGQMLRSVEGLYLWHC